MGYRRGWGGRRVLVVAISTCTAAQATPAGFEGKNHPQSVVVKVLRLPATNVSLKRQVATIKM
ncbi:hypothetical protein RvY_11298 [Ramazzottius varieornatus]|uniref:Kinesin motor domain-containing protein n=1 Tax=Ramazzottius varieornatus TaxID=947166 RepID=A0A1D1VNE7_RAMVA|nr:hypothetical protein RvY_11298 [Ramazzottius varieornatus]